MADHPPTVTRRTALQAAAGGIVLGQLAPSAANTAPAVPVEPSRRPGQAGDFDFLAGNWNISHRRLKGSDWDLFDGEASCWTVLGGVGSIEELRIPARHFSGIGIRLLDLEKKRWSDFWVNGRSGVLTPPGMSGWFDQGVATFEADDMDGDQAIKVRGVWDRITPRSCRWHQAVSRDGGASWQENWFMDWVRA